MIQAALPDADWPTMWSRINSRVPTREARAACWFWFFAVHDVPATHQVEDVREEERGANDIGLRDTLVPRRPAAHSPH